METQKSKTHSFEYTLTLKIPFPTERLAVIANKVLAVDKELKPNESKRNQKVEDNNLIVIFEAISIRVLRVTSQSFLDFVILILGTIDEFD
ncbi:hypothetical protein HDU92_004709 [Lobulomyces angularis]|nr:hypothetical protein HDU92_004709 [Lobulomyces angularis]